MLITQFTLYLIILSRISGLERNGGLCRSELYTDQCKNTGLLWNCSQLNLKQIPNLTVQEIRCKTLSIDLSRNMFTSISQNTFTNLKKWVLRNVTALYFGYNELQFIDRFAFEWLYKLCVLDVSYCNLYTASFRKYAFSNLGKLEILYVQGNVFHMLHNKHKGYPDREISRLLALKTLHIDVFEGFTFTNNFKRLRKLSIVEFYTTGSVFHLTNNTFSGLSESPIRHLKMIFLYYVRCDVSEYILCYFPYLKGVEMNFGGICGLSVVLRTLKCLRNRTMDFIHATENVPYIVRQPFFLNESNCEYLLNICVKKVDFSSNRIAGISVDPYGSTMGKCIEYLNLSRNNIEFIGISIVLNLLRNYPKLNHIDFSSNNVQGVTTNHNNVQGVTTNHNNVQGVTTNHNNVQGVTTNHPLKMHLKGITNITITTSKELETLCLSNNHMHDTSDSYGLHVNFVGKGLKELNVSRTNFPFGLVKHIDFPQLQTFDISNNNSTDISFQLLRKATELKNFIAVNTNLDLNTKTNMKKIFRGLKNLYLIDLRNNFIHKLPRTLFRDQSRLSFLYLDNNYLSSIPFAVGYLSNLTHLYLQSNKISSLNPSDIHILQSLKNIHIFLKGNILNCDCLHISSLQWMKRNQHLFGDLHETECTEISFTVSKLLEEENFAKFEKKCLSQTWLIFSSSMLVLMNAAILVSALLTRYRVHVDYIILRIRNRLKGVYVQENKAFKFDAFISYAEDDLDLVRTTLYQVLTNSGFQITLPDKDFIPGMSTAEQLVQSIDHSRKVVFIITENLLTSGWNSYAVQMAVTHAFHNNRKRSIIVIIKDKIPIERMPKDLQYIWWCIASIWWPETLELMDGFWKEVTSAITLASD